MDEDPKAIFGMAKPSFTAIPPAGLLYVGQVMETGANKYGLFNWRTTKVENRTYINAAMRHLLAYWDGQDLDEESHLPHLAHAAAGCMIVLDALACGRLTDMRGAPGMLPGLIRQHTKGIEK